MLKLAKEVLKNEAEAILNVIHKLDNNFEKAAKLILNMNGRLIVSGMGKSGLIGRKIAATFASLGTSAYFMHPAEAIHGDLGMIMKDDIVLAISNSGETKEVIRLVPFIKGLEGKIISFCGDLESYLAKNSDITIYTGVHKEACPLNLAPTSSTTVTLAMGDALAVVVANLKGIKAKDFAKYHPGGSLGQKLLYRVKEVMHTGKHMPVVYENVTLNDAIQEISNKGFGFTTIVNKNKKVIGILTDGDLRRIIQENKLSLEKSIKYFMTKNPKIISKDTYIADALEIMEKLAITSLVVADSKKKLIGIVHLHDLLGRGNLKIEL